LTLFSFASMESTSVDSLRSILFISNHFSENSTRSFSEGISPDIACGKPQREYSG